MENKEINLLIDGRAVKGQEGQTILEVAIDAGIEIPNLCYHSDLKPSASCRLCIVSIEGRRGYSTACSTPIEEGMSVVTDSEEMASLRKTNLELLFAQHIEKCNDCIKSTNCRLLELARRLDVDITRFEDRKRGMPEINFGPSINFDKSKCIECRNCIDACKKQSVSFLETCENGPFFQICPSGKKGVDCVYCGQCVVHCPTGALQEVDSIKEIQKVIDDGKKTVIFQIAPAVRTSIGEEFGMGYGAIATEKIAAGIRRLGVERVFDVSAAADLVTMEEAKELIERVRNKGILPMFTSCCPAWVKFVEFFHPEMIPHLTTVRSPQVLFGGLTKTLWAKKEGIDPKDIFVVSIMPCTAKKYEVKREEMMIDGMYPVDAVLTTHELACYFRRKGVDLSKIDPEPLTPAWGDSSGAGVIYGASGGVTESALRTAVYMLTGNNPEKIEFQEVRGLEESKEALIDIDGVKLRVAVVNGLGNAEKLFEKIKEDPNYYQYIEVMACPGGCIGGGGQPLPTDGKIRKLRAQGLYKIDTIKEKRYAHENPFVKDVYESFFNDEHNVHKICHTTYRKKEKENNF
jgi:iron-only hydrogenase group A